MYPFNLTKLGAIAVVSLAASTSGFADLYFGGTNGGNPNSVTAISGPWDYDTTANWATSELGGPGSATSTWSDDNNADFEAPGGGTVTVAPGNYSPNAINFLPTSGTFVIINNGDLDLQTTGIANNSLLSAETISNQGSGIVEFESGASASGGSAAVTYSNSAQMTFHNDSLLGNANITNNSTGTVSFDPDNDPMTSTATLDNSGVVDLYNDHVSVNNLTVEKSSELQFTLGANTAASGELTVNTALTDDASQADPVLIDITEAAGFGDSSVYTLIDLAAGTFNILDYSLNPTITNYRLEALGSDLDLVAVPEVSSFMIPLALGAAGFFWMRRRAAALSAVSVEALA